MNQSLEIVFKEVKPFLFIKQIALIEDVETVLKKLKDVDHISDYSFLVAPVAKAYEGFLKDYFLKIGIINDDDYQSDHFRVGKTLNPSLRYKRFSIYQKLANLHKNGEELAEILWTAWKFGRNEIFHYFPQAIKNLSRQEAEDRIQMVLEAIIKASEFLTEKDLKYV